MTDPDRNRTLRRRAGQGGEDPAAGPAPSIDVPPRALFFAVAAGVVGGPPAVERGDQVADLELFEQERLAAEAVLAVNEAALARTVSRNQPAGASPRSRLLVVACGDRYPGTPPEAD